MNEADSIRLSASWSLWL